MSEEAVEFSAGSVKRALRLFRAVMDEGATVSMDCLPQELIRGPLSQGRIIVQIPDDLPAQQPKVVHMLANGLGRKTQRCQMLDERPESEEKFLAREQVFFQTHPGTRPTLQVAAISGNIDGLR